jgi:hypothetical protein
LFVLWAAFAAVADNIYCDVQEARLLDHLERVENDQLVDEYDADTLAMLEANEERQEKGMLSYLAAVILGTICLLVWINRTNHACRELGAKHMKFTPGWAVGYWFVPFLNLVRPFQIMRELWTTTDPNGASSPLIGWWWGAWLASGAVSRMANKLYLVEQASVEDYRQATHLFLASDALDLIGFALTIAVVTKLTARLLSYQERVSVPVVRVVGD